MGASFEEKSVWIQLIGTVVGLGAYFVVAGRMIAAGVTALPAYAPVFIVAVVFMVILLSVGHIAAAMASRRELAATGGASRRDERDTIIAWRAESNSGWIVAAGVVCALGAMVIGTEPTWVANGLIVSLFLSEVVGYILRLVYYRRGMTSVGGA